MQKSLLIIALIIAVAGFAVAEEMEKTFPDFTLKTPGGEEVTLSERCAEGPVIVTFWATWCKPCRKELGKLSEMHDLLEKHGVEVIAISEDGPRTRARVRPFVRKEGWDFTVLLDPGGKVKVEAGVADIPELFMLTEDRQIVYRHVSYKPGDEAEYKEKIAELFPAPQEEIEAKADTGESDPEEDVED